MQVHAPSKSLILKLRNPERVTQHIPRARVVPVDGVPYTQVKFGLDEARVLRNLGIAAPSPIRYFYDWPIRIPGVPDAKPFEHQVTSAEFFTLNNRCINLSDMGTGKTKSAAWSADYLMRLGVIRKAIIVCPKSTMNAVWLDELQNNFLGRRKAVVLHGSRERRLKLLAEDADFYIINHDGLKVIADALAKRTDINLWIYDEASAVRNPQSQRHKLFAKLVKPTDWMWLMTGTPCPKEPTDVWGLAKLLGSKNIPHYFTAFRNDLMLQITQYKWVPKPDAFEKAYAALTPSIRFKKSDCIDLPPVTFTTLMAEMSAEQKHAYEAMRKELVADVKGVQITAAHAATKLQKLLQISMGVVLDEYGDGYNLDANERLGVCAELIDESSNNAIVFVPYTKTLDLVAEYLRKRGNIVEIVDGRTSNTERKRIFDEFQNAPERRVLVAHPATTAHGLTLTRADLTIWYGPIMDLEIFEQANNRMDRPGQKNAMTVACIATNPMELELYSALKGKQVMQNTILAMFKNELGLPNN
jgi:SNF2 family DNA or RNA helicase